MAKGIRPAVNAKFLELAPKRLALEFGPIDTPLSEGNTEFRRAVMNYAMKEFDISLASAATAYNTARIKCGESNPELVVGLGRPDDKKGGRKPGSKNNVVVTTATGEGQGTEQQQDPAQQEAQAGTQTGDAVQDEIQNGNVLGDSNEDLHEEIQLFEIVKQKDGTVVKSGLNETEAVEYVRENGWPKVGKSKLDIRVQKQQAEEASEEASE